MYCISDEQVEYILNDISARGIETEDLQLNLLDHICCIIEHELEANGDFELFYAATIQRFYKAQLREIEDETISLLLNKNYYAMKKIMIASGLFSAVVFMMGIVLKFLHAPGASFGIVVGITTLSLIFLPLVLLLKVKEQQKTADKVLTLAGSAGAALMSLSILFRVMHWPYSLQMGYTAVGLLSLLFLPIFAITGLKKADTRVNTIVTSVIIVGACCLWLTLVSSPVGEVVRMTIETSSFLRSEQILKTERGRLVKSGRPPVTGSIAHSIDQECETLKSELLQRTCGHTSISQQDMESGTLIHNTWVSNYLHYEAVNRIHNIKTMIAAYNKTHAAEPDFQAIPVRATILDMSTENANEALNSLLQIQMCLLQDEAVLPAPQPVAAL